MAEYEHREGSGSIFPNRKKSKDTQPDHRGEIKINGVVYEFGCWVKQGKSGPWLSVGGAKPKEDKPRQQNYPAQSYGATPAEPYRPPSQGYGSIPEDMIDDIPFSFYEGH